MSEPPAGLRGAPLTLDDLPALTAVWRAGEEHDDGEADCTEADVRAVAGRPSLDLARDSMGVRDGDALVAFGVQIAHRITFAHVLPGYRGRGSGPG